MADKPLKLRSPITKPKHEANGKKEASIKESSSKSTFSRLSAPKRFQPKSTETQSTKINRSNMQIKNLSDFLEFHNTRVEFLYLRNNLLTSLYGLGYMPNLRVLDLSNNQILSLEHFPELPSLSELYLNGNQLVNLEGLPSFPLLEVLVLTQNNIETLKGMPSLPKLKALFLSTNQLSTFEGIPVFKNLMSLRINDNPLCENILARMCALVVCGTQLERIDAKDVTDEERQQALSFPVGLVTALRYGFMLLEDHDSSYLPSLCFDYLLEKQRISSSSTTCQLTDIQTIGDTFEKATVSAEFYFRCHDHIHRDVNVLEELGTTLTTGNLMYRWYRGKRDGTFEEIVEAFNQKNYLITSEDIFSCLKLECIPVLPNQKTGPSAFMITSDVLPLPPNTLHISIEGTPKENEVLRANVVYEGGDQGRSLYRWFRCSKAPKPVCVQDIDVNSPTYTVTWDDVGSLIKLEFTPVRLFDNTPGRVATAWTTEVTPVIPIISNIAVKGKCIEGATLTGEGKYSGQGPEGNSIYRWYRCDPSVPNAPWQLIVAGVSTYTCVLEDVRCLIKFEITPYDQRGVEGITSSIVSADKIKPGIPVIEKLRLAGQCEESLPLTIMGRYFGGVEGASVIQWHRIDPSDESNEAQEIPGANSKTYVPTVEDIGCFLLASYTPIRSDGVVGKKESVMTGQPIRATTPTIEGLAIVGDLIEGNELIVRYTYKGGEEGKSQFFWSRCHPGKAFVPIASSESKRVYFPERDDIGCVLKFTYTPIREDGEIGKTQTATTERPL